MPTWAVPVPLHRWRRLHRGFNQAAALAAGLGLPMCHALRRVRPTPAQVGLTAAARRRNVRDAFAPAWRTNPLAASVGRTHRRAGR
jgi:predicted amidophosphoribosyltransferase